VNVRLCTLLTIKLIADQRRMRAPPVSNDDLDPAAIGVAGLGDLVSRQKDIADGHISAAKQLVVAHHERFAGFQKTFKPAIVASVPRGPTSLLDPDRYVAPGESVTAKSAASIKQSIVQTLSSDGPARRVAFISLRRPGDEAPRAGCRQYAAPASGDNPCRTRPHPRRRSYVTALRDLLPVRVKASQPCYPGGSPA
jgi:hypothetical protein